MHGQGRVFQRGRIWWIAFYHRGRELRESSRSQNRRQAERLLRERLRTSGLPTFVGHEGERLTISDLGEMLLADHRVNRRRSIQQVQLYVERLAKYFAFDRVVDITTDRIVAYTDERLRTGLAPATVNRDLAALRRMFNLGKLCTSCHRPC